MMLNKGVSAAVQKLGKEYNSNYVCDGLVRSYGSMTITT